MKLIHIVEKILDLFWFSIFLSPNKTLFILTGDGSNGEKIYLCKALILSHLLTPLASYLVQFLQLITQIFQRKAGDKGWKDEAQESTWQKRTFPIIFWDPLTVFLNLLLKSKSPFHLERSLSVVWYVIFKLIVTYETGNQNYNALPQNLVPLTIVKWLWDMGTG